MLWYLSGFLVILIAYMFYEPFLISVIRIDLHFSKLPKDFEGFTILHLSDLHTSKYGLLEKRARQIIKGLHFDVCAITGDLTTKSSIVSDVDKILDFNKQQFPVYVVTGNSEYKPWADTTEIIQQYKHYGYNVLSNSSEKYKINSSSIKFAGVEDPYTGNNNLDAAFDGVNDSEFVVGLAHCPSVADNMVKRGASLILAGHTHGGQIRLPGVGVLWSHMKYNNHLNDGFYDSEKLSRELKTEAGESKLFVNRGLGTSRIHLRLNCRPQIALIQLHRKA